MELFEALRAAVASSARGMDVRKDTATAYEVYGTKTVTAYNKTMDGMYFASVRKAKNDVAFYFFPLYTHPREIVVSEALAKRRTGKSCFHVGKNDAKLVGEIKKLVAKGKAVYRKAGWI